jgi:hypothetical protein
LGPDSGYTPERWMDCLRHLLVPLVYKGDNLIQKTLQRSKPLPGQDKMSWLDFVNRIMEELKAVLWAVTTMPEERNQVNPVVGLTPSMPDMLKLVKQSLILLK